MSFDISVPDEIAEWDDEKLLDELEALAAHEDAEVLTDDQRQYLNDIRNELYKRMAVGGPYADYEGGTENDEN